MPIPSAPHLLQVFTRRLARFLTAWALLAAAQTSPLRAGPAEVHPWISIEYPPLAVPGIEADKLIVLVQSGREHGASHLRFDVLWSARWNTPLPAAIADAGKLAVRLHLADGKVILPEPDRHPPAWIGAGSAGATYSLTSFFPWQRNVLEEAWFELSLPGQTYWVELPYGFTRNPDDAFSADAAAGAPAFPPTMKAPGEKDRPVPWLRVNYDLGAIQNGWRLFLKLANPSDAQAEVILYRDDMRAGKSMFLWKLDTPRTALEIKLADGGLLAAHGMGIRLHEDGMRRSDDYSFNRYPQEGRDWGKVIIGVDGKAYECAVPSSLFKYNHGATDQANSRRLPRPRQDR